MKLTSRTPSILIICITLSGFSALIYEIVWFRRLANVFGSTVQAASITSAVFLAGLALGAVCLGRYSDRVKRPLIVYVLLELVIAASGLLVPLLINSSELFVAGVHDQAVTTLLLGIVILLVPTMAMGGTLPVLCRVFAGTQVAERLALLYALNTAGGAVGCLTAGFLLIPRYGEHVAIGLAVLGNLLAAGGVYWAGRQGIQVEFTSNLPSAPPSDHAVKISFLPLVALTVCGFATLAAQILWLRLLPLFVGNTTYAFSLVLSLFLFGIATGSALYRRFLIGKPTLISLLLPMILLAGGFLPTILAADRLTYLFYLLQLVSSDSPWLLTVGRGLIIALLVLPPTLASGALLPALVQWIDPQRSKLGLQVGRALFANTAGAVVGSLSVPLLLIPNYGIQGSFRLVGIIALMVAVFFVAVLQLRRKWCWAVSFGLFLALCLPLRWDYRLLSSGVYLYSDAIAEAGGLQSVFAGRDVLSYEEGLESTVTVFGHEDGRRYFSVNGKVDGGNNDMPTQVLLGQLPLLLHPQPQRVMVIGLGTGITLAETLKFSGLDVVCSEIEPGVVRASEFFKPEHGDVLSNSRVKLKVGDARQQLLADARRYDVIISEPSNPWQSGNSRLFTRDFYQLADSRLNDGGIFCQWLPIYDLPPEYLKSAVATFVGTFPHAVGFLVGRSDLILVARKGTDALAVPYQQMKERWRLPGVNTQQFAIGNDSPENLLARHLFGGEELLALVASNAPINSDAHNRLEFMPKLSRQQDSNNLRMLQAALETLPAWTWVKVIRFDERDNHLVREVVANSFAKQGRQREAYALVGGQ